ncbi:glucose-6-phosphate dehydrogenase [Sphingomonas sp. ID0503]|uniref:glucose-6-phosphate dehydrogenase n=1 Tax=Sphingomonas sp. ID0503 TaxID=3399691 RepID=UPI003AFA0B13
MMGSAFGSLLLFGATGDLSQRMLLPSLYGLHADKLVPDDLTIFGTARSPMSDEEFRQFAAEALKKHVSADRLNDEAVASFLPRLRYVPVDASQPDHFDELAKAVKPVAKDRGLAIFLSTAPSLFASTIDGLKQAGLTGDDVRLALEKPLGTDLASSREVNDAALSAFPEERTFRIDHYLGKETVQNLLVLRFGNLMFEPLWNNAGIDYVQITIGETVGLEGRAGYYDGSGALRDMVQNHMLQLLALVAMEAPARFDATAIRNEKVKVLSALRPITTSARDDTVTGQYAAGVAGGAGAPGYIEELGKTSDTETFVAIRAHVDNWRWAGVPFYLRTGKRLPVRTSEIVIQFKSVPHSIFKDRGGRLHRNRLVIKLQPEESVSMHVMAKVPGLDREGIDLREVPLDLSLTTAFAGSRKRIAYERLLLDLLEGDPTLFVRRDEVEAQWAWIDGIRKGWAMNQVTPKPYPAGTWGPAAAIALTERDGVHWND